MAVFGNILYAYLFVMTIGIAKKPLFAALSSAYPFTSGHDDSAGEGVRVYPEVYESRQEDSEKILVIEGYSLNLKKASVLADTVLLMDVTEDGTIEQYVQGAHYERDLFEDVNKQASLILKPAGRGDYHITGMVNSTHRIEPCASLERSSQERLAHRISIIDIPPGTYDIVDDVETELESEPQYAKVESRELPPYYTIETHFITDINHTAYFGNNTEDRVAYSMLFMHSVSLRLQQLEPPARIGLTVIEGLQIVQPYLQLYVDGNVMADQTLDKLGEYAHKSPTSKRSDIAYMVTSLALVKIRGGKYVGTSIGMAHKGQACRNARAALGLDRPVTFSGVQTAAHEIAHLLNAPHDGDGEARDCSPADGYLMNSSRKNGNNSCTFSSCTKKIIADFIQWPYSSCLMKNTACHVISLPNKASNLPGDTMDGPTFCKEYYRKPRYVNSTYLKLDSDLKQCLFRCLVEYTKPKGKMENRTSFAMDGTPCSESEPLKICHNMKCVSP
ncbi:venom metalloproteinase antarease-like TtrivMP_A [Dermacentor silvarum]|uniref:venom metalloproteinase antarease-like TtrivMP_A n=1 Tax=Dermacentor silvarum TaxID=543639 RepID=UPI0021008939|nr:venom metalloproteinase antarease-like TtrivMP_A [Dermacentor silvarum]